MLRPTLMSAAGVLALAAAAPAQYSAADAFAYPAGQSLNGQNGGTGWGNAWNTNATSAFTIAAGSLSDPSGTLATSGNSVQTTSSGNTFFSVTRSLSTPLPSSPGSSVWVSFLSRRLDQPAPTDPSNTYGGLVIGGTGGLFIGDPGAANTWAIERAGGGGPGSLSNFAVTSAATLLVANIQFRDGADEIRLYVNPTPGGDVPASTSASLFTLDLNPSNEAITSVGLWFGGASYQFDELRFGDSYAVVVAPVPEPATVGLLAATALGLTAAARRRFR